MTFVAVRVVVGLEEISIGAAVTVKVFEVVETSALSLALNVKDPAAAIFRSLKVATPFTNGSVSVPVSVPLLIARVTFTVAGGEHITIGIFLADRHGRRDRLRRDRRDGNGG